MFKTTTKKLKTSAAKSTALKVEAPGKKKLENDGVTAVSTGTVRQPERAPVKTGHLSISLQQAEAHRVFVAGSFNGWAPETTPLAPAGNGRWVGELAVAPGRYEYLFVVDGQWLPDPNAKESVANPYGGRNSVLTVSE